MRSCVICAFFVSVNILVAQQTADQLRFEVASVRPTDAQFASGVRTDGGRLTVTGVALGDLIRLAYGVSALQVSGVPPGLGRYDISATAGGAHTRAELLKMLQALLATRFKLTLHRETREMSVQALIVGKGAIRLEKPVADVDPDITLRPDRSADAVATIAYMGQNVTLPYLANYVSGRLREIVVDRTALAGSYDFHVTVDIDRARATDPSVPEGEIATQLYTEFVKNLGLRLERQRASIEVLVVDHAEIPGEN